MKLFSKKSQGLSLNVIIVAAIVLIVLVVLWSIFTGRMGGFSEGVDDVTTCSPEKCVRRSECKVPDPSGGEACYKNELGDPVSSIIPTELVCCIVR